MEKAKGKKAEKSVLRGFKGDYPRILQRDVMPYIALSIVSLPLKQAFSLSYPCLQFLLIVAYFNGTGNTITGYMKLLYGYSSKTLYVSIQQRIDTLLGKGLIERYSGKYRLSEKGVRALSSVLIEGEGAKLLLEIERKQARSEAARAKRLAKKNGDL